MWNYWKCKVERNRRSVKRPWNVVVIETDLLVKRCGTWSAAVRKAIKFQHVQNKSLGKAWKVAKIVQNINKQSHAAKA